MKPNKLAIAKLIRDHCYKVCEHCGLHHTLSHREAMKLVTEIIEEMSTDQLNVTVNSLEYALNHSDEFK